MARQEDACWRCGVQWASEDGPGTALRVIPGGVSTEVADAPRAGIAATEQGRVAASVR
jgi:hypothetical protein